MCNFLELYHLGFTATLPAVRPKLGALFADNQPTHQEVDCWIEPQLKVSQVMLQFDPQKFAPALRGTLRGSNAAVLLQKLVKRQKLVVWAEKRQQSQNPGAIRESVGSRGNRTGQPGLAAVRTVLRQGELFRVKQPNV